MAKKKAKNRKNQSTAQKAKDLAKKELTEEEKARLATHRERSQRKPIKFKSLKSGARDPTIALQDPDDPLLKVKMLEALGTADSELQCHLLDQVLQTFKGTISRDGADHEKVATAANNAMSVLNGIQPQDEIEGMLAVQMIGVHNLAMEAMQRAMLGGQTSKGRKVNVDYATKMVRTFMMLMETLKKYRTRGPQKLMVGHVKVSEGGQAIVGTVNQRIDKRGVQ